MLHDLVSLTAALTVAADPSMPTIDPNYDFPAFRALGRIISWVLGGATMVVYLALIVGIVLIAFKGFGNSRAKDMAVSNIGWVLLGAVVLSSLTGIWAFMAGFDLGF